MSKESVLLQPLKVGKMILKNRIMFPPLTTGYEERDGSIGQRSFEFYKRLAKGGAAYVVIGDVAPVNTASPTPKLYDERQIPTFKKLADALHDYDCKLALQLFHPEYDVPGVGKMIMQARQAGMLAQKAKQEGNMELFAQKMEESQRVTKEAYAKLHHDMKFFVSECSHEQLNEIKEAIARSAKMAQLAGVDAIEVHGDRLLGSLCSTILNHRKDEYGGSLENRTRYALEVVQAIKEAAPDLTIEYKLPIITINPDGSYRGKGGLLEEEAYIFAQMLEKAGVEMIQVAQANHTGNMGDTIPPMGSVPYNWTLPVAKKVKQLVSIPVATVGRVVSVEAGEKIVSDGQADIVGYGRSLLTDPDIAIKIEKDEPVRECLNCNKGCVDAIQNRKYISCVLNAENGDEATIYIKPNDTSKNIAVVGGGIAGCEAARVLAKRNHKVTLFEATSKLGGQINLASIPPRKMEILRSIKYYEKILPSLNVNIQYNTKPDSDTLNQYDEVIVAIGASNFMLPLSGNTDYVVSSWDVLEGKVEVKGKVAVIGGGLVGTETAEYLAEKGCDVSIIEMTDKIAAQESGTILPLIQEYFKKYNVKEYVNTKVCGLSEDGKTIYANNPDPVEIQADAIVMAVGSKKLLFDETGINVPVHYVGDCSNKQTADIASAIRSAYHCANEI